MNSFPRLLDSHCHLLSLSQKGLDPKVCLQDFFSAGGQALVDVAVDDSGWEQRLTWCADDPRIGLTSGIHPSEVDRAPVGFPLVREQSVSSRCWAIGEIGLDWFRGRSNETQQRELFRTQLQWAQEIGKPIVIHNRQADAEILADLAAVNWQGEGILHCFSSDQAFAERILDRGLTLSFAGNLTYPSAQGLRQVAAWVPVDRLLIETDSPYLAPQPVRGTINRPVNVVHTLRAAAEVRNLSPSQLMISVERTFARIFPAFSGSTTDPTQ